MTATLSWAGSIRIVFSDRQFCVQKSLSKVTDSNGKWPLKKRCQPYEQRGRVNILVLLYCRTAFFGPNVQTQEYPRPSRLFANNLHIQVNICSVFHLTRPVRGSSKSLFGEFLQYYLFWRSWNVTLNITSQFQYFPHNPVYYYVRVYCREVYEFVVLSIPCLSVEVCVYFSVVFSFEKHRLFSLCKYVQLIAIPIVLKHCFNCDNYSRCVVCHFVLLVKCLCSTVVYWFSTYMFYVNVLLFGVFFNFFFFFAARDRQDYHS